MGTKCQNLTTSLPTEGGRRLVYVANELHTHLLTHGPYRDGYVVPFISQLAAPDDAWYDDVARVARDQFLQKVREARTVRHGSANQALIGGRAYRGEMERNKYDLFLTNLRDRLIAALSGDVMPTVFHPNED